MCQFQKKDGSFCKRKSIEQYCWQHVFPEKSNTKQKQKHNILKPPEFMKPTPLSCEGYWSDEYKPKKSIKKWKDKENFIQLVEKIETHANLNQHSLSQTAYLGKAYSRIDHSTLSSGEFVDSEKKICWPKEYVKHYIGKYNVMPTRRFFEYITQKYVID